MSFDAVYERFWELLHNEILPEDEFPNNAPLLAHYTSLANLENILKNQEVWLSNPLFMNDLEEVRFGVNAGVEIILESEEITSALADENRAKLFRDSLLQYYNEYASDQVLDLYVMCFSLHQKSEPDGKLSMWRGYGQNGKGCALVFDTSKISAADDSPLVLAPVKYGTQGERRELIRAKILEVSNFIAENEVSDDDLFKLAFALFRRICLFAVFTKHSGFLEEDEWRLVYFKERDSDDRLHQYFSYFNGPDGIQPKLKLPTIPITGVIDDDFSLTSIIHLIIVGPSASSPMAKLSVERMLRAVGFEELKSRLHMSGIPFRG